MSEITSLPFKISVLVFLHDRSGRLLLIQRRKAPNLGCWSPIGGKLEMARGESPLECALRETEEETGLVVQPEHMKLFAYVSEKAYEDATHWLMFLFNCETSLASLPEAIDEGAFAFFTREAINTLDIPETDRQLVWPWYDTHRERFIALRADCRDPDNLKIAIEREV